MLQHDNYSELIAECHRRVAGRHETSANYTRDLIKRVHEAIIGCETNPEQFQEPRALEQALFGLLPPEPSSSPGTTAREVKDKLSKPA